MSEMVPVVRTERTQRFRIPWLWLAAAICAGAACVIVPACLLYASVPDYIPWILAAAAGILTALVWIRTPRRRHLPGKIVLTVVAALGIVLCVAGTIFNPYWNSMAARSSRVSLPWNTTISSKAAVEDLDWAWHYLKKDHPALLEGASAELQQKYDKTRSDILAQGTLTVSELAGHIESVLSSLNDAHTGILFNEPEPLYMKYIDEHMRNGDILTAFQGKTLEEIGEQYKDRISADVPSGRPMRLRSTLITLQGLMYLGVPVDEPLTYTYRTPTGEIIEDTVTKEDFVPPDAFSENRDEEQESFVHYEIYPDESLAVLYLDECTDDETYRAALNNMFTEVRDQGLENVAVDLRTNGGGSSSVATTFMAYLDTPGYKNISYSQRFGPVMSFTPQTTKPNGTAAIGTFDGNVYVLTSPDTFSSAMLFAEYIKDNELGKTIGEAPANDPNGYGETAWIPLPNSALLMQVSTKKFNRIDGKEGLIEPDIPCDTDRAEEVLFAQCGQSIP